jgi:cystathionine beta-lyase/cystathionine gamma-synthase
MLTGGIVSRPKHCACCYTFLQNLRLINLAVSLGGVESLISHPASMTHGPMIMTDAEREEGKITPGLIRLRSVSFIRLSLL